MGLFDFARRPTPVDASRTFLLSDGEVRDLGTLADPGRDLFRIFSQLTVIGLPTGADAAMRCSASYSAIRLISDIVADLPVYVFKRGADGSRERQRDHIVDRLMNDFANPWTTGPEFRRDLTASALVDRGFAAVIRVNGSIKELHQCRAVVVVDPYTAEPTYQITRQDGSTAELGYADVIDIHAVGALAPAKLASRAIELSLQLEHHAVSFFRNGGRPSGLLTIKSAVDATSQRAAREAWKDAISGENAAGVVVLGNGTEYTPLTMTAADAEFNATRLAQIREVLRFFGVSSTLVGELQHATLANNDAQGRQFLTNSIGPWLATWIGALSRCLLTAEERASGIYLEFDTTELVAADIAARFEALQRSVGGPWQTANEAREGENLPRLTDPSADKLNPPQGAAAPTSPQGGKSDA